MAFTMNWILPVNFPIRLIQHRKEQGLTQQALADASELHITQVRRYELGEAQPTLEALIKLAKALHVSLDELVFDDRDRGPSNDRLVFLFEAIEQLKKDEQSVIRELLEGMVFKYQARRWTQAS
ncbi:helix-turn-helix transcriptional regulator [uncultured Paraglaciecola sp.]|uniref:helix-turn-helix domain-containing protein n=1 Tax=uncultured Paraglaciecola sp. TaxID=1765024 RepID=UPI00260A0A7C|nr:helix-turn-helix transcriptional regulator [uncultured Paraglaciecola sp.]